MNWLELAAVGILLLVTIEQAVAVAIMLFVLRRRRTASDVELPDALVVLAIRGRDPSLVDCLRALFQQDYPRYRVRVVVDSPGDPAWGAIQQVLGERHVDHVEVRTLDSRLESCSLKCSALLQATEDLDDRVSVVAFVDADVAPHRTWLRELVAPLADSRIGAVTGNRWYAPRRGGWGSVVRVVWNVGAVANMYFWSVPWGGTLAMRADILRNSNLRSLWSRAGCDDVPLHAVLRRLGLRLYFEPNLLLANWEECALPRFFRFMWRQLLWVRLYHPSCWWGCAVFHFLGLCGQVLAVGLCLLAIRGARWGAAGWLAAAFAMNHLVIWWLVLSVARFAGQVIARHGERPKIHAWKLGAALPFTLLVSGAGLLWALFGHRVEWRGVHYEIRGAWRIRMIDDAPRIGTGENDRIEEIV